MTRKITRRDFLKLGVLGTGTVVLAGCKFPPRYVVLEPYVRPPEEQLTGQDTWYASTCRQCPAACGVIVRIMNGRALKIEGNLEDPYNHGKLCARGHASLQILYHPDRLRSAVGQSKRGSRAFTPVSWNDALSTLTTKLKDAGSGVAFWAGPRISAHLYHIFASLVKAVGGPPPVIFDQETSLNGDRALLDNSQALMGVSQLPAFDLSKADLVLSFGGDFLGGGNMPVYYNIGYGSFRDQSLGLRGYLVQFESRMSLTGAKADEWIPLVPGTEGMVAQAIVALIASQALGSPDMVDRARSVAVKMDFNAVVAASQVSFDKLSHFAKIFATSSHPLAIPGGNIGGKDNAAAINAVQLLNYIAGAIGKPGGVLPGSDSGLVDLVKPPVSTLAEAQALINAMRSGQVKVLMVYAANLVYDLPQALAFNDALAKVPFVVSFGPIVDEMAAQSDLVIPDRTPLESWGYEIVSTGVSAPFLNSQQPVVQPLYDTPATGDVILSAAHSIPTAAAVLPFNDEVEYLRSVLAKPLASAFASGSSDQQWSVFLQHGGVQLASATAPGVPQLPQVPSLPPPQYQGDPAAYPYYLVIYPSLFLGGGSGASQLWLQGSPDTMTSMSWQTWVQVHPSTAQKLGINDGDIVKITSPNGEIECLVDTYPGIRPDTVAVPTGQGHTDEGRFAQNRGANPVALLGAQADASGNSLLWTNLRVNITKTGGHRSLALFEHKLSPEDGVNSFPVPGV
jgi:anaerobic selenocysteine-containing dehydrogenase